MLRTTKAKVVGLVLAGAVVLSVGIYATTAFAAGGPFAETETRQPDASTTEGWREGMLEMLEDHMGLSGRAAEDFADEMTEHMRGFDEDFDFEEMVDWCTQYGGPGGDGAYGPGMMDEGVYGPGMMNDGTYGPGMMRGGAYGPGMMDEDFDYDHYDMMDGYEEWYRDGVTMDEMMDEMMDRYHSSDEEWHMMDSAPLREPESANQTTTAKSASPTNSIPRQSNQESYGSGSGGMMGTASVGNSPASQDWGMMDETSAPSNAPTGQSSSTKTTSAPNAPSAAPAPGPTTPATQDGGFGPNSTGMMDGGMMGTGMMGR